MFRLKTIIIMYETKTVKSSIYGQCRIWSYGTLFEKTLEKLFETYGDGNVTITNVIKL